MTKRAVPTEAIERRIIEIDERLATLAELQRERALLLSLLENAVDVEQPEELGPDEASTLTDRIVGVVHQFPEMTSGGVARYLNAAGVDAGVKVIQTIIGQQVRKGTLRRSPDGRLRIAR